MKDLNRMREWILMSYEEALEETIVMFYCFGHPVYKIYSDFLIDHNELYDLLAKYGIRKRRENLSLEERNRSIVRQYERNDDLTMADVGEMRGLSKQRIFQIVTRTDHVPRGGV